MLDDLRTFLQIKEGNIKAFESLFKKYYTPLCRYVTVITSDPYAAEEIIEELFYRIWRDRSSIIIMSSVSGYLYKCSRNDALAYCDHEEIKRIYKEKVMSVNSDMVSSNPQQLLEFKELENLLNNIMKKLPPRCLDIFRRHRVEGKKYSEIALELSISVKTVEANMTKALKLIRKELDNYSI